jgi:hypothetical protein
MESQQAPVFLNPLEALEAQYEKDGQEERASRGAKRGVVRASSAGHHPRRLMFDYFPDVCPPESIKGRGCRTFEVGDQRHDSLRQKLARAGLKGRIPLTKDDEEQWELPIPGTSWVLRGHPDGVLEDVHVQGVRLSGLTLLEVKTTGSFGWREVTAGIIDGKYLAQSAVNCEALGCRQTYFLYERKDTQHLAEVVIPHDPATFEVVMMKLREAVLAIEAGLSPLDMPACHGPDYGWTQPKRGPMKLGWRCSYCPFVGACFPEHVRWMDGAKPVCTREEAVPDGAVVVAMGNDVLPRETWKIASSDEESSDG